VSNQQPQIFVSCQRTDEAFARQVREHLASAGLHPGEVELLDDDVRGVPVRIATELAASAGAGEVLVSNTVRDLVAGLGLRFAELGARSCAVLPNDWRCMRPINRSR
jgi:class 3 adenylate cyclase